MIDELRKIGLSSSGYLPESKQRCVQLSVNADDDLDKIEASLNLILPHIIPVRLEEFGFERAIYITLFDFDCSEFASFNLCLDTLTDTWWLLGVRYRSYKRIKQFQTLREMLEYLQKEHPYEGGNPTDRFTLYYREF